MYSPKIREDLICELYARAANAGKPMTKYLDDLLRPLLVDEAEHIYKCSMCQTLIEAEVYDDKAWCEYCESEVFVDKTTIR